MKKKKALKILQRGNRRKNQWHFEREWNVAPRAMLHIHIIYLYIEEKLHHLAP